MGVETGSGVLMRRITFGGKSRLKVNDSTYIDTRGERRERGGGAYYFGDKLATLPITETCN